MKGKRDMQQYFQDFGTVSFAKISDAHFTPHFTFIIEIHGDRLPLKGDHTCSYMNGLEKRTIVRLTV